jgi:hypothetical protein
MPTPSRLSGLSRSSPELEGQRDRIFETLRGVVAASGGAPDLGLVEERLLQAGVSNDALHRAAFELLGEGVDLPGLGLSAGLDQILFEAVGRIVETRRKAVVETSSRQKELLDELNGLLAHDADLAALGCTGIRASGLEGGVISRVSAKRPGNIERETWGILETVSLLDGTGTRLRPMAEVAGEISRRVRAERTHQLSMGRLIDDVCARLMSGGDGDSGWKSAVEHPWISIHDKPLSVSASGYMKESSHVVLETRDFGLAKKSWTPEALADAIEKDLVRRAKAVRSGWKREEERQSVLDAMANRIGAEHNASVRLFEDGASIRGHVRLPDMQRGLALPLPKDRKPREKAIAREVAATIARYLSSERALIHARTSLVREDIKSATLIRDSDDPWTAKLECELENGDTMSRRVSLLSAPSQEKEAEDEVARRDALSEAAFTDSVRAHLDGYRSAANEDRGEIARANERLAEEKEPIVQTQVVTCKPRVEGEPRQFTLTVTLDNGLVRAFDFGERKDQARLSASALESRAREVARYWLAERTELTSFLRESSSALRTTTQARSAMAELGIQDVALVLSAKVDGEPALKLTLASGRELVAEPKGSSSILPFSLTRAKDSPGQFVEGWANTLVKEYPFANGILAAFRHQREGALSEILLHPKSADAGIVDLRFTALDQVSVTLRDAGKETTRIVDTFSALAALDNLAPAFAEALAKALSDGLADRGVELAVATTKLPRSPVSPELRALVDKLNLRGVHLDLGQSYIAAHPIREALQALLYPGAEGGPRKTFLDVFATRGKSDGARAHPDGARFAELLLREGLGPPTLTTDALADCLVVLRKAAATSSDEAERRKLHALITVHEEKLLGSAEARVLARIGAESSTTTGRLFALDLEAVRARVLADYPGEPKPDRIETVPEPVGRGPFQLVLCFRSEQHASGWDREKLSAKISPTQEGGVYKSRAVLHNEIYGLCRDREQAFPARSIEQLLARRNALQDLGRLKYAIDPEVMKALLEHEAVRTNPAGFLRYLDSGLGVGGRPVDVDMSPACMMRMTRALWKEEPTDEVRALLTRIAEQMVRKNASVSAFAHLPAQVAQHIDQRSPISALLGRLAPAPAAGQVDALALVTKEGATTIFEELHDRLSGDRAPFADLSELQGTAAKFGIRIGGERAIPKSQIGEVEELMNDLFVDRHASGALNKPRTFFESLIVAAHEGKEKQVETMLVALEKALAELTAGVGFELVNIEAFAAALREGTAARAMEVLGKKSGRAFGKGGGGHILDYGSRNIGESMTRSLSLGLDRGLGSAQASVDEILAIGERQPLTRPQVEAMVAAFNRSQGPIDRAELHAFARFLMLCERDAFADASARSGARGHRSLAIDFVGRATVEAGMLKTQGTRGVDNFDNESTLALAKRLLDAVRGKSLSPKLVADTAPEARG